MGKFTFWVTISILGEPGVYFFYMILSIILATSMHNPSFADLQDSEQITWLFFVILGTGCFFVTLAITVEMMQKTALEYRERLERVIENDGSHIE